MSTETAQSAYIPGVCNINRAEIAYRRKAGYFGVAMFVIAAGILVALSVNRWVRLLLFVPAFIAVIGFLQARSKFCVSYAASGQQNADEGSSSANQVADAAAKAADKRRARRMNTQAALIALAATLVTLLIP